MMLPESSKEITSASSFENEQRFRQFTLKEIEAATNNFRAEEKLGEGGIASVFKGNLSNEAVSIIKTKFVSDSSRNFPVEIERLANLQHPNIVRFIGYCHAEIDMLYVFEYMPRGTLGDCLHCIPRAPLSWSLRLKICIDAARALHYLHSGNSGKIYIHGDVTISRILLDVQFTAKLAVLESLSIQTDVSTTVKGTFGYIDPEYFATGHKYPKTDVYSFGVILLEVLCRRRAVDSLDEELQALATWAQQYLNKGKLKKIIDPELKGQISHKCLNDYAKIVKSCLHTDLRRRSTMAEVLVGLESILALQVKTDMSLEKYISSSEEGYFRKAVNFLSSKSRKHKDHGNISDIKAISEASKEKNPKHNITISSDELNPPSDSNREFIDQDVLSTSRTESSRDLIRSNYLQRAYILTRRKDFLHLMWFYPVKKEAEVSFGFLVGKFSSLNKYIRTSLDSSTDGYYLMEVQTLLQDLEEYLEDAAFDMEAYLPEELLQNRLGPVEFQTLVIEANSESLWSDVTEVHAKSIASATDRALRCIKDLKVQMLGIWGSGVEEVTATLKDMPVLKNAFDMVLLVRIKRHTSIEDIIEDIEEEIDLWKKRSSENPNKLNVLGQFLNCLLFVDCSEGFFDLHERQFRLSKWFQNVQIVMTSGSQRAFWQVEMEIRVQDHRLPWNIFFKNVDIATMGEDSGIKQLAVRMVEKCDGHLLAIILLARALRGVVEIGVWELALQELVSSSQSGVITDVMVRVLRFIWPRMETVSQKCIIQFALRYTGAEFEISSLINCWTISGVVKSETEAEHAFEDLERLFLIERLAEKFVRMRDETRVALLGHFIPRTHGLYLKQDGSKSHELPSIEEWDVREIHLTNNILSELPDNLKCPILVDLFLHSNQDLMDVPITFFDNMPSLQVLDLSSTSLKSLPSSISKLTTLRKLFIRNCDLMMEIPPEIGSLKYLKVFDSEGTQLICLPKQVGSLTKLECLKFSLCNFPYKYKRSNQNVQIIPVEELSKLVHLKELSICVDLYGEWWKNEVKLIIDILPKLRNLESLRLHFPTTELFCMFIEQKSWEGLPIYQHLSNFKFIVGDLQQRLISRLPFDLDKMFVKLPKSLKFTSTEGEIEVISSAMKHANALFLDRHWTIQSLSTFGLAEMKNLKFCLFVECSEMLEIVNGSYLEVLSQGPVLGSLEYISIHRMKSLSCIWNGPIHYGCLSNLKTLVIHACPELRTVFTQGLLDNLTRIEYLAVEDCPKIRSLVSLESNYSTSTQFLPRLKKISLLHLSELVTISNGTSIAPRLESLVVYDCPNLQKLSSMEVSDHVKEIKGETEWWDGLKWCEPEWTSGQPEYLARVFIPLGTDDDIMDELADAVNFLPHVDIMEVETSPRTHTATSLTTIDHKTKPTYALYSEKKESDMGTGLFSKIKAASDDDHDAAMKLQKFYRGYRTRRLLADSAVFAEELWWKVLDFAQLDQSTVSFFNYQKPESAASRWNRISLNAFKVGKGLSLDSKAQKLAIQHWIEAIDPRHRYGHSLHIYYEEWCKADAGQPFFYWLDVGEGKEVDLEECPRSKLRQECIKYLGPQERENYEYIIVEGKIMHLQTQLPLDTNNGEKWIFVMSASNRLYAGEKKKGKFHHSSFLAGGATLAAGRLDADNGTLKSISPYSGHYRPSDESLKSFLSFLKENGVDLDIVKLKEANEDYETYEDKEAAKTGLKPGIPISSGILQSETHDHENKVDETAAKNVSYERSISGGLKSTKADVSKKAILDRINSKAASSYQLGHQLLLKWSSGVGPRICCIADYPVELRLQALEFTNLSPKKIPSPNVKTMVLEGVLRRRQGVDFRRDGR